MRRGRREELLLGRKDTWFWTIRADRETGVGFMAASGFFGDLEFRLANLLALTPLSDSNHPDEITLQFVDQLFHEDTEIGSPTN